MVVGKERKYSIPWIILLVLIILGVLGGLTTLINSNGVIEKIGDIFSYYLFFVVIPYSIPILGIWMTIEGIYLLKKKSIRRKTIILDLVVGILMIIFSLIFLLSRFIFTG
jgi:hypothetical protein